MTKVPSRKARLAHTAKHAELWNAGRKQEWVDSRRTIIPAGVRLFDPVGTEEKTVFAAATTDGWNLFQNRLRITMLTVQIT
ncbi:hypothetical protein [Nocardia carnea]|uniref:hypothetical protein n=1 Tax=Nocardia carnea TaxID=37328 RepID=UPI00245803C0|nr:hypothetical protein [Nocardia carnea]